MSETPPARSDPDPTPEQAEPLVEPPRRSRLGCMFWLLLLWGLGVLWGVTLMGRVDSTPAAPLVIAVLVLPWLHAAGTILVLLAWIGARRSRWVWLLTALHLGLELGVRGQACTPACRLPRLAEPRGAPVSLMAWNLGRLGSFADPDEPRCEPEAARTGVLDTIQGAQPTVLALLEISGRRLEGLADELAMECEQIDYYGRGGKGTGGLAVCVTRDGPWKITRSRDLPLPPGWRYVFTELSDGERTFNVLALHVLPYGVTMREVERALRSAGRWELGPLAAVLTQMEEAVATQAEQIAEVRGLVSSFEDPTIIAGDFNSTPDSAIHATLRRQLTDVWHEVGRGRGATRVVDGWLPLRIDYVYTTPELEAGSAEIMDCRCAEGLACSDHQALMVELTLE
jgi:endonuclease/exonuclease/phosphatase family metal-dependent hydrolase